MMIKFLFMDSELLIVFWLSTLILGFPGFHKNDFILYRLRKGVGDNRDESGEKSDVAHRDIRDPAYRKHNNKVDCARQGCEPYERIGEKQCADYNVYDRGSNHRLRKGNGQESGSPWF